MNQTFGEALIAKMAENDHTFRELGVIFDASAGGINRWANDLATPEVQYLPVLLEYLDVSFEEVAAMFLLGQVVRWERRRAVKSKGRSLVHLLNEMRKSKTRNRCSAIWDDRSGGQVTGIGPRADEWAFDGIIFAYSESAYSVRTMMG